MRVQLGNARQHKQGVVWMDRKSSPIIKASFGFAQWIILGRFGWKFHVPVSCVHLSNFPSVSLPNSTPGKGPNNPNGVRGCKVWCFMDAEAIHRANQKPPIIIWKVLPFTKLLAQGSYQLFFNHNFSSMYVYVLIATCLQGLFKLYWLSILISP